MNRVRITERIRSDRTSEKYPCYDAIAAARGGFAGSNGEPDGAPMKAGNANCDTLTGTHALTQR